MPSCVVARDMNLIVGWGWDLCYMSAVSVKNITWIIKKLNYKHLNISDPQRPKWTVTKQYVKCLVFQKIK